jgi:hypothetical protein
MAGLVIWRGLPRIYLCKNVWYTMCASVFVGVTVVYRSITLMYDNTVVVGSSAGVARTATWKTHRRPKKYHQPTFDSNYR